MLLVPVSDPTAGQVIWREFDLDPVSRQDTDVVHPHLPTNVGEDLLAGVEFDSEHHARELFDDLSFDLDALFFYSSFDLSRSSWFWHSLVRLPE